MLQPAGRGDVRSAAEIGEGAVGIDRDGLVVAQLADALQLERIVGEASVGALPVHHLPDERVVGLYHRGHPGLDLLEVFRREGPWHFEVVVEAVLDWWAESDARTGEDFAHRRGKDMGSRMAQHLQRVGVAIGKDGEGRVRLDGAVEIADGAVHARRQCRTCQSGPNGLGHLPSRGTGRHFADRAVGKRQRYGAHGSTSTVAGGITGSVSGASTKYAASPPTRIRATISQRLRSRKVTLTRSSDISQYPASGLEVHARSAIRVLS